MSAGTEERTGDVIRVPSDRALGPPAFSFVCPEGWTLVEQAGVIAAVAEPAHAGRFRTNAVLIANRVLTGTSLDEVAAAAAERAVDALPSYALINEKIVRVDGYPAVARTATHGYGDVADALFQLQVLTIVPRSSRVDGAPDATYVWQLTATCESARAIDATSQFLEIAGSVRLEVETA